MTAKLMASLRQTRASARDGLRSYGRILAYVRPHRIRLALAAAILVLVGLLTLVLPWAVQRLVDGVVVAQDVSQLDLVALVLFGTFLVRSLLGFVSTYLLAWVGERVVVRLRRDVYEHLLTQSLGYFSEQRTGEIVSRISNDVLVIQYAVTGNLVGLLQQVVTAAGIVVVVGLMNWRLTLVMALALPGMMLVAQLLGRRMRRIAKAVQNTLAQMSSAVEETVGGIRTVKSFAREDYEGGRFAAKVDTLFEAAMHRTRLNAALGPLIGLLLYGSMVLVLWLGGREVLAGRLTPGQLISFLFYAVLLIGPLGGFAAFYGQVQSALGATERVFELMDAQPEISNPPGAEALPALEGRVVFEEVSFEYSPRQPVLDRVSLHVEPGEVIAVVGPSGVGKTTLVHLIPRFYDPSAGRVLVDGRDLRQVTLRSLRDQVGIVPQDTLLFSDTVAANIRYGRLDATQAEVEEAARAANAHDFVLSDLPDGYETQVGERGIKLSTGQRQRIAIARAILKRPRILILDEATSSLDTEAERLVQQALERLMHPGGSAPRPTTFVIAHRLSTIVNADRILVLHQGRIVEQGTHQELLARTGGLYRHYYALQFQWEDVDNQKA
ncbi:MAG TPA: ABC transporter ATP-binding protein [Anaerolineae bacterium]|nr:ABC transporter ATP-binding protein [Anaerolineae bacterium]